jgi:hypothetical protein
VVGATARPPSLESYRAVCDAATSSAKAVVVGPLFAQPKRAGDSIHWLAIKTASAAIDERRILKAMHRMAAGAL